MSVTPASSVAKADDGRRAIADGAVKKLAPGQQLLNTYCISCHGEDKQKGKIRFDTLDQISPEKRTELLTLAREVIHFGEMPPPEDPQPTEVETEAIMGWLGQELESSSADAIFAERMLKPGMGNYVDHDKLFSGEYAGLPASTPARRWLISPYIFNARMNEILEFKPTRKIAGVGQRHVIGDNLRVPTRTARSQSSRPVKSAALTNPFQLPKVKGVQYFDTEAFHGGHLLTMLGNAESTTTFLMDQIRDKRFNRMPMVQELMASRWDQDRRLADREYLLENFMHDLLPKLYGDRDKDMFPKYEPVVVPPYAGDPKDLVVMGAAAPIEVQQAITETARRVLEEGDTPQQLAAKCDYEWFIAGVDLRTRTSWMTFMRDYAAELMEQLSDPKSRANRRYRSPLYRELPEAEMQIVAETIRENRVRGDFHDDLMAKCMEQWREAFQRERDAAGYPSQAQLKALVEQSFAVILNREPDKRELDRYVDQTLAAIRATDRPQAIQKLIQTLMLRSEFVYRYELGEGQPEDEHGRRMLSPRELTYAIAYALTDSSPDEELVKAAEEGRLTTREDVKREVERMLANRDQWYIIDERVDFLPGTDSITNMPIRELRFFRDFFGYPKLIDLFKDDKRFGGNYQMTRGRLIDEADMLVAHIVEKDQNVFENLLTTEEFFVFHNGDPEVMKAGSENHRAFYDYFRKLDWKNFKTKKQLLEHEDFFKERRVNPHVRGNIRHFKRYMTSLETRFGAGQVHTAPFFLHNYFGPGIRTRTGAGMRGEELIKTFNLDMNAWDYPVDQPAYMPNRKGILTHPAWLIAHSQNTETDPVIRGLWVRMMLLAGTVPDVPINVDAVVPPDKTRTLRQRHVSVTEQDECWRCHVEMNPLGYPFEMYDDFGRFRTEESLEHPDNLIKKNPDPENPPFDATSFDLRDIYITLPVDPTGYLSGTGDPELDGEVTDALDLIDRLAKSDRVRQSIIRHAFRYFVGRNEVLSDSSTLIEADKAYIDSGGSFDAVIFSLLTSDSFLYRVDPED